MNIVYGIIVTGKEALDIHNHAHTKEGEKFWVIKDSWGPSSSWLSMYKNPPPDILVFNTSDEAESFAKTWKGHPWWCVPKDFEVVKLKPKMIHCGYELCTKNI